MTKDEALKRALEALEEAADAIDSWGSYASGYFQVKHDLENDISKAKSAITAIKAALEAKDEPWEKFCDSNCVWTDHHPDCKLAKDEPDKYAMDIECTKCGAKQSGVLTVHTTPPQRKSLREEMVKQMKLSCDSMEMRGAFADGWLSAEAAHGIKGEA